MENCKGTILLMLNNEQNDYAKYMKILENIQKEGTVSEEAEAEKIFFFENNKLNIKAVINMTTLKENFLPFENLKNIRLEEYNILFEVFCNDNENDIVNLQFFFLVRKWLIKKNSINRDRIGLYIKASQVEDARSVYSLYYKAIEFLTYQCVKDSPYFIDNWEKFRNSTRIKSFKVKSDVILKKFSPLIDIADSKDIGIRYWQQSVGDFLENCKVKNIFWNEIECLEILNADKENAKKRNEVENIKKIETKIKNQRIACTDWDYRLMWTLKECFCTDTVKVARKRIAFCNSDRFKESIKEMSLLSFYIFCLFEYNSSVNNETPLDYENNETILAQIILKMRDIGDGFFQLMLNTVEHSEFGEGYFNFRIHNVTNKKYLKNKYKEYMNIQKDSTDFFWKCKLLIFLH